MQNFLIALGIGVVAGIIDAAPMVAQKMDRYACLSAFAHWVVLGLIIPFVNWGMAPWLQGLLISVLSAIPVMLMVYPQDKKAIVPIFIFSAVLGMAVGFAGMKFIHP